MLGLRGMSVLLAGAIVTGCGVGESDVQAEAFDFLEGSWTTFVDGLSVTLRVTPDPDGTGWLETRILDDGNHVLETASLTFDADASTWTRRSTSGDAVFLYVGRRTEASDEIVLDLIEPGVSTADASVPRIVYRPDQGRNPMAFSLELLAEGDGGGAAGSVAPGLYDRVVRPDPPQDDGRIAFISNRSGDWEVFTMTPGGADVRNLTSHEAGDHYPRWIAGGTRLSFRSQRSRQDGAWDRWEVDLDGTDLTRVPIIERMRNPDVGDFPELDPTGSWFVNAARRGADQDQDLFVWRRDGTGERALAPGPGLDYRPLFSPDGDRVLFISERDGNAEIYSVSFDGTDLRRLTDSPGIDRYARWSPDGSRIAFVSDRDGDLEIFVMADDGSDLRQLTRNDAPDGEVTWSPDATRLAYRSDVAGNGEIHVVDVTTGEIANISRHESYDGEPVWSPAPRGS